MRITTDVYDIEIKSLGEGWCGIYGDTNSLGVVTDGVILCGTDMDTGVVPIAGGLKMREYTVVLWLQQEVYGFLDKIEFE